MQIGGMKRIIYVYQLELLGNPKLAFKYKHTSINVKCDCPI